MTQCSQSLLIFLDSTSDGRCTEYLKLVEFLATFGISVQSTTDKGETLSFKNGRLHMGHDQVNFTLNWAKDYDRHLKKKYSITKEPLAKSLGLKGNVDLEVVDCTLGTGKDSILMLSFGIKVRAFERNKYVFAMAADAYLNALTDEGYAHIFKESFSIFFGQATLSKEVDCEVAYYDPMYPTKKKKALARKEMQVFKKIVGADLDEDETFLNEFIDDTTKEIFQKSSCDCDICKNINHINDTWNEWVPKTKLEHILKKNINNIIEKNNII